MRALNKNPLYFSLGLLLSFIFLTGCGYRFGNGALSSQYCSISVPYAEGDLDGSFTTELIKQVATSGVLEYKRVGANLVLKVSLIDLNEDNIGFRYYRKKDGHLTTETIPVETRLSLTAEVSVIDATSCDCILSPVLITAYTDFDHDYYSTRNDINVTSLGQLTDYDEALDAAKKPLHFHLAKKIVDYISDSW